MARIVLGGNEEGGKGQSDKEAKGARVKWAATLCPLSLRPFIPCLTEAFSHGSGADYCSSSSSLSWPCFPSAFNARSSLITINSLLSGRPGVRPALPG